MKLTHQILEPSLIQVFRFCSSNTKLHKSKKIQSIAVLCYHEMERLCVTRLGKLNNIHTLSAKTRPQLYYTENITLTWVWNCDLLDVKQQYKPLIHHVARDEIFKILTSWCSHLHFTLLKSYIKGSKALGLSPNGLFWCPHYYYYYFFFF